MKKLLAFLFLLWLSAPAAAQQQVLCPTRPGGDASNACASTAFVTSAVATSISGYTSGLPLIGQGASPITTATKSGSTTTFATSTGTLTNGHCVSIDSSGNFIDAGGSCTVGGGGGTVNAGTAGQLAYYATSTNAVSGTTTGTGVLTALGVAINNLSGGLATMPLTTPVTHKYYTGTGVDISKLADRVFVGDAILGGYVGTSTSNTDWWDTVENSLHGSTTGSDAVYAQFVSTYDNASVNGALAVPQIAIAGAVHSNGGIVGGTPRAIEYAAYADNNVNSESVWGIYGESNYIYGSNNVYGYESEVRAWNSVATGWTPYTQSGAGLVNQEYGCGSGRSATYSCTAAVYISANPNNYGVGILFLSGSVGALGVGATTPAIEMPYNYQIQWYKSGTTASATISADASGNLVIGTNGGHLLVNSQQVYCGAGAGSAC